MRCRNFETFRLIIMLSPSLPLSLSLCTSTTIDDGAPTCTHHRLIHSNPNPPPHSDNLRFDVFHCSHTHSWRPLIDDRPAAPPSPSPSPSFPSLQVESPEDRQRPVLSAPARASTLTKLTASVPLVVICRPNGRSGPPGGDIPKFNQYSKCERGKSPFRRFPAACFWWGFTFFSFFPASYGRFSTLLLC